MPDNHDLINKCSTKLNSAIAIKGHYQFTFTMIRLYHDYNSITFFLFYFGGDGVINAIRSLLHCF